MSEANQTESYKAGYKTGLRWSNNWRPGGPHVLWTISGYDPESKKRYDDWMRGFDDGYAVKLRREAKRAAKVAQ